MTREAFDLYRAGNTRAAGMLIRDARRPASTWTGNLSRGGLGKPASAEASTVPTVSIADATASESDGTMTFTVTVEAAVTQTLSVGWATSDGGATAPGDYGTTSGTLTFESGDPRTQQVSVPIVDDDIDEADEETFTAQQPHASLGSATATGTIIDDDVRAVTVTPTSLSFAEGGSDIYTVVLTSEPTVAVTVTPDVAGNDDVTTVQTSLTFTPSNWDDQQTVTVEGAEDEDAVDDTATVEHAVSGGDYGGQ